MRRTISILLLWAGAALAAAPLDAAREAFVKGDYQKAITLARAQVPTEPGAAWRVIGASTCFLKDSAGAREAYDKLGPEGQQFLRYVCKRNGVLVP
jgi:hypothetical protein